MQAIQDELKKYSNITKIATAGQKEVSCGELSGVKYALKSGKFAGYPDPRIEREIAILTSIHSSYFPKIHHFVQCNSTGEYLIVEEYIEHLDRAQILAHFDSEKKLIMLLEQLVEGLKILWNQGIVHRDIKPDNILIKPDFSPVIIDLGIAKDFNGPDLTATGWHTPLTVCYSSPEQLRNHGYDIDHRTDIFLLGIYILELHLGYHPFNISYPNNRDEIPKNILSNNYVDPSVKSGTSIEFCTLISKMLKPKRYDRFKNADQLLSAIEGVKK